jgi:lipoate-protein ligase A
VYLDPGTVCAAIALPADHPAASASIPELYAPLLDGMVRACGALGVDATRDERTVRVGDRKVTGIAAHRGRHVTLVHGTLLVAADLDALRACLAGSRGGDLQERPRPAPSRPDHVALVGGDAEAAEAAVIAAFALPGARVADLTAAEGEAAAALLRERYRDRAWHAGPWHDVTPDAVRAVLGA